jgi:hypothetical protein
MNTLGGVGPYGRILLQLYLIYLVIYKRVKIPPAYFILYAVFSLLHIRRIILLSKNAQYSSIHGYTSFYEMPIFHEQVFSFIINMLVGIYLCC